VKNRQTMLWVLAALLLLLLVTAVSIPNLLRSRMAANESALVARSRNPQEVSQRDEEKGHLALRAQATPERKLIQNAELGLIVGDVRSTAEEIRRLTELSHGEIDKLEILESSSGFLSATLLVRVPASGLGNALTEFKKLAVRVEREQISARDVSSEFYDNEAHMSNLRAEEQQYLAIMKQARTIKDTLEVSEKLSDARDKIERLQTQIQLMTHDIEMSLVNVALMQASDARVSGVRWRPVYNAKMAAHDLLVGLSEWSDWFVAVVVKLPLIALWAVTVGGILWIVWRIGQPVWQWFLQSKIVDKHQ
jgi:uncharacterized protein DUF4349